MSELIAKESDIAAYFAIHSYSQIWMYPWGYTTSLPPNNALLVPIFYIHLRKYSFL
jgi:hypothetical protein